MALPRDGRQTEYRDADILIDQIVEWIALKWSKTMMWQTLRKWFPDLRRLTFRALLRNAERRIAQLYGIDPEEYKGRQIAFYEAVVRGRSFSSEGLAVKMRDRLQAAERLDKLFGFEGLQNIDPESQARKIIEFKRQAEASIGSANSNSNPGVGQASQQANQQTVGGVTGKEWQEEQVQEVWSHGEYIPVGQSEGDGSGQESSNGGAENPGCATSSVSSNKRPRKVFTRKAKEQEHVIDPTSVEKGSDDVEENLGLSPEMLAELGLSSEGTPKQVCGDSGAGQAAKGTDETLPGGKQ